MIRGKATHQPMLLLLFLALTPFPALGQSCPDLGAYCEGWSRDSTRREVSLSRTAICNNGNCPAVCNGTTPIVALPSIRVGNLDHVVLGFAVGDACVPECASLQAEPCFSLGVSYRRAVATGSEDVTGTYDCDPTDPGTVVSAGATYNATYATGGTDQIVVSNIVYGIGSGPDDCGSPPTSLTLVGNGPTLAVQSQFTFTWLGAQVTGYSEVRTYTSLPAPNNVVHITVSNINYGAGTYTASAPDAVNEVRRSSWGSVKIRYR